MMHQSTGTASRLADIRYLYLARAVRGFGDGFAVVVLPAYLTVIGYDAWQIGLIATAALLGSAVMTVLVGFYAGRHELRLLFLASAGLMVFTGIAIANFEAFAFVLVIVFFGTVNPSTGEIGIFVPLEHAQLARNAADSERTTVFARYSLIGALAGAVGALAAGAPDVIASAGFGEVPALRAMFYGYALLGALGAGCYWRLSPVLHEGDTSSLTKLHRSRRVVYKLAALFSVDAFAGGFVVQSLLALWLFQTFGMSLAAAGLFFFWANALSALSYPVAARLAKRFGLINTMVFTHIPSSMCLIGAAFSSNLRFVIALLLIRAALSQMDVPTRTSYVMAVVTPSERPPAASVTAVSRSLASALSPALAGALLSTSFAGLPLVICGSLKMAYDVCLLFSFRHIKPPEEA